MHCIIVWVYSCAMSMQGYGSLNSLACKCIKAERLKRVDAVMKVPAMCSTPVTMRIAVPPALQCSAQAAFIATAPASHTTTLHTCQGL